MNSLGSAYKNQAMRKLRLTPKEANWFNQTNIIQRPNKYFRARERKESLPYQLMGEAPFQPFAGQPYNKPWVDVRESAVVPDFNLGNLERFSTQPFVTPEQVIPHEMGHIVSSIVNPQLKRPLTYENLDDEGFAESFRQAVEKPRASLGRAFMLRQRQTPIQRYLDRFIYNPEA